MYLDQLMHSLNVHVKVIGFLPDRCAGAVAICVARFHRVLLPRVPILEREYLIGFKSLKMAHHSRFTNQASHSCQTYPCEGCIQGMNNPRKCRGLTPGLSFERLVPTPVRKVLTLMLVYQIDSLRRTRPSREAIPDSPNTDATMTRKPLSLL